MTDFRYATFDLDGTLLGADLAVDRRTVDGLLALKARGCTLFVASGRSPYLLRLLDLPADVLDLFDPTMVLRDGDIRWHRDSDTIEAMRTVPAMAVAAIDDRFPHFVVDTGTCLVASSAHAADRHAVCYRCPRWAIRTDSQPPMAPVAKATVYADPVDVTAALSGVEGCGFRPSPRHGRCSIVPDGSCKTAGVAELVRRRFGEQALDHVVAFGDGGNDACLLACAGAGVAMAVADPGAARSASLRLTGTLAGYLTDSFPTGLGPARTGARCPHRT